MDDVGLDEFARCVDRPVHMAFGGKIHQIARLVLFEQLTQRGAVADIHLLEAIAWPRGLAHGFIVRSENADFFYKCDELYSPSDEKVLRWNDPELAIGAIWPLRFPCMT